MGRPHKYAGSRLTARTTLSRERVLELARAAAAATVGNAWDGRKELRLTASGPDGDRYAIHGALLHKPHQLDFRLMVADVEDGARREVATEITWYVQTQSKIFLVIPFGTATMLAHDAYLEFAQHLAQRLSAEDPAATVTILKGQQVVHATGPGAAAVAAPVVPVTVPVTVPATVEGAAPVLPPAACAACSAVAYDDDVYCGQCGTPLPAATDGPAAGPAAGTATDATTDGAVR